MLEPILIIRTCVRASKIQENQLFRDLTKISRVCTFPGNFGLTYSQKQSSAITQAIKNNKDLSSVALNYMSSTLKTLKLAKKRQHQISELAHDLRCDLLDIKDIAAEMRKMELSKK